MATFENFLSRLQGRSWDRGQHHTCVKLVFYSIYASCDDKPLVNPPFNFKLRNCIVLLSCLIKEPLRVKSHQRFHWVFILCQLLLLLNFIFFSFPFTKSSLLNCFVSKWTGCNLKIANKNVNKNGMKWIGKAFNNKSRIFNACNTK